MSVSIIAQRAGVSNATVSRVLNKSKPVSAEISARVKRAMLDLQLRPEQIRRRRTSGPVTVQKKVAIVGFGHGSRSWLDTGVVSQVVGELGYALTQMSSGVLMVEMPDPHEIPSILKRPDIGGVLVFVAGGADASVARTLARAIPTVRVLGGEMGSLGIDHITTDNHAVGNLAAQYLLSKSVDELAFVTFSPEWAVMPIRLQGFMATVPLTGPAVQSFIWPCHGRAFRSEFYGSNPIIAPSLEDLVQQIAAHRKGRLGLFVSRDEETARMHHLLLRAGLRLGEDVVLISCDNEQARLASLYPRPATIDIGTSEVASRAARRLAVRMKYPEETPVRILVRPRLVESASG